jgi:DNA-binding transcriptional LysR family regulator
VIRTDLTTLRVFLAVYNLKNITKAAEREHIAPSAVSKRIQDLEAELDTQLFYRHPRGVTATPAGEALAGHTQQIFEGVNQMAVELSAFARGTRGQVRIHAHASAVSQYLPAEIASFVRLYPEVRVVLREETSPNVLQSTLDGIADIGIFASLPAPAGLQVLSYREDQLVALLPVGHPLAGRERVDFRDIRESDHISLETGSSLQVLLARAAEALDRRIDGVVQPQGFAQHRPHHLTYVRAGEVQGELALLLFRDLPAGDCVWIDEHARAVVHHGLRPMGRCRLRGAPCLRRRGTRRGRIATHRCGCRRRRLVTLRPAQAVRGHAGGEESS